MINIIVPIYNEETILARNSFLFQELARKSSLIFVDGGSHDKSVKTAENYSRVLRSKKGRAMQMNCGASAAKEDILLFLHADTAISLQTLYFIEDKLRDGRIIGGCLTQRIDKDGIVYRFIENLGNMRSRITRIFYGDQGIFVRKDIFLKTNGFPEVPIMEDVLFSKKLRKLGKTAVLPDKIFVSPRRWEKKGIIRTTSLYILLSILHSLRIPLSRVKLLYDDLR